MIDSAFIKCIDVVTSCETLDQLYYATRYVELTNKHHRVIFSEHYMLSILCKTQFNEITKMNNDKH